MQHGWLGMQQLPNYRDIMKKPIFTVFIVLFCCHCFGQEKEYPKSVFSYSIGLAYNQIWLQSYMYGTDEYGVVSSSPFNWGITPSFSMEMKRWRFSIGCSYLSFSRKKQYSQTQCFHDKWQEASLALAVGYRVTGRHSLLSVSPFLGIDLSYLINYETTKTYGSNTTHYNTEQIGARDYSNYLGFGLLGGISVSYPITKHFEIGLSYCIKYKIINNIRNDSNPHYPSSVTSPIFYHNAIIGFSYRFSMSQ